MHAAMVNVRAALGCVQPLAVDLTGAALRPGPDIHLIGGPTAGINVQQSPNTYSGAPVEGEIVCDYSHLKMFCL